MNQLDLVKVNPTIVADVVLLLARLSTRFRAAFDLYLKEVSADLSTAEVARYITANDQRSLLQVLRGYLGVFTEAIADMFEVAGRNAAVEVANELDISPRAPIRIAFDPGESPAAQFLERSQLRFIREFTDQQRAVVFDAIAEHLRDGSNPLDAARVFKNEIGLTQNQWQWVRNYRRALEQNSSEVFDRILRDRRYDRTVAGAIRRDEPLSRAQINRMVDAYTRRMIAYRSRTIARTESMRTMSIARHEGWRQQIERLGVNPENVLRTWNSVGDDKVRDTHDAMDGQEVIGLDTPFESPSGAELLYPGDMTAPPEEVINCRCVVTLLIPGTEVVR